MKGFREFMEASQTLECSKVAIETVTGGKVRNIERTLPQTVFAIEDMGYTRDTSPTRLWHGRKLSELIADNDIKLGVVGVKGHIMPIVNRRVSNINGHGDEAITAVVAFSRSLRA